MYALLRHWCQYRYSGLPRCQRYPEMGAAAAAPVPTAFHTFFVLLRQSTKNVTAGRDAVRDQALRPMGTVFSIVRPTWGYETCLRPWAGVAALAAEKQRWCSQVKCLSLIRRRSEFSAPGVLSVGRPPIGG